MHGAANYGRRLTLFLKGGTSSPPIQPERGCMMTSYVTYSDLIQIGILIVSIISLILQSKKKK